MPPLTLSRIPCFPQPFEGVALPFFSEVLQMVEAAHATVLPGVHFLGWDVALTPEGPRLIDCNTFCSTACFGDALPRMSHALMMQVCLDRLQSMDDELFK